MRRTGLVTLVLSLVSLSRCSLVVGDFEVPACSVQADCEVLNAGLGPCERYVCVRATRRCVQSADGDGDGDRRVGCGGGDCDDADARRSGRRAEVCDGVDNDCDLFVDEGVILASRVTAAVPSTETTSVVVSEVTVAGAASRSALVWHGAGAPMATVAVLEAGALQGTVLGPIAFFQHASADLGQPLSLVGGCVGAGACIASELALDDVDASTDWFAATVNTAGCAAGDLRVGHLRTAGPQVGGFVAAGPRARGASHEGLGGCVGAWAPRVSRLRERGGVPRALVAWNVSERSAARCGMPAPIDVAGLYLEGVAVGGPWVNTTNAGASQRLAMGASAGAPAIASYHRAAEDLGFGWFLAWADADGSVGLRFVPRFDDSPTFSASLDPLTPRATPALNLSGAATRIASGGAANDVVIAVGEHRTDGVEVGLSWQDACGRGRVWFARARYALSSQSFNVEAPMQVSQGPGGRPAIRWVSDGFLDGAYARGAERAGEGVTGRRGGWLIAWSDETRLFARRVSSFTGAFVDDAPAMIRDAAGLRSLTLSTPDSSSTVRGFWFNQPARVIEGAQILCAAAP